MKASTINNLYEATEAKGERERKKVNLKRYKGQSMGSGVGEGVK